MDGYSAVADLPVHRHHRGHLNLHSPCCASDAALREYLWRGKRADDHADEFAAGAGSASVLLFRVARGGRTSVGIHTTIDRIYWHAVLAHGRGTSRSRR